MEYLVEILAVSATAVCVCIAAVVCVMLTKLMVGLCRGTI